MELFAILFFIASFIHDASPQSECTPIYVRWPRVRLNLTSRLIGSYSLEECASSCSKDEHPGRSGYPLQCSGFNHKHGASSLTNDCQIYQKDQLSNLDGNVEYDDRYSFYWKYCVKTKDPCKSVYHYDFHIDRYMDYNESARRILTFQIEDCLEECLREKSFECRSVSFNRTAGYCYLSTESRLSKPTAVRVNGNPNYRIDYYENKCHNDCFTFHHECQQHGILVNVDAKFPYTGAMYGLYDFFSCRIEPREETKFEYFFPFSSMSKNCSDSMSIRDGDYVLEVVLSTDNVIPLYFLTDEDLIYKAKCPVENQKVHYSASTIGAQVELVPPFSKSELVTSIPVENSTQFSSASASASSASSIPALTFTFPPTHDEKKKPIETLPSLDTLHEQQEKKGNKITLFIRYPENVNVSMHIEENDTDSSNDSPTTSTEISTENSTTENSVGTNATELISTFNSTASESAVSTDETSLNASLWTSESISETTSRPSTVKITSTVIPEPFVLESTTDSPSTSTVTLDDLSTTESTKITSTIISDTDDFTSTSTESSTSETPTTQSTTESITTDSTVTSTVGTVSSSKNPREDEEEVRILPFIYSTISPSNTSASEWLFAWRFRLSTQSASVESHSIRIDPQLNIDSYESISSIKSKDLDSDKVTTEWTSPSTSTTTSDWTSSTSTTTSTSTSTSSSPSTTVETSTYSTPFWPFVVRTKDTALDTTTTASTSTSTSDWSTSTSTSVRTPTSTQTAESTNLTILNFFNETDAPNTTVHNSTSTESITNWTSSTTDIQSTNPISTQSPTTSGPPKKILFDIFHNGQPISAVVVGSRIILSFLPSLSLPGNYMTLVGCQVEPVNSPYAWERDPLQIVKNGCQADGVGLVCPPLYTEAGVKVEMEGFRYTTTGEVLYSCLIRICPYGPCPQPICTQVDGCNGQQRHVQPSPISSPSFPNTGIAFPNPGFSLGRKKRQQAPLPALSFLPINTDLQPNLVALAGDHVVTKKLVVVNSEGELQYYLRTGNVPSGNNPGTFFGR